MEGVYVWLIMDSFLILLLLSLQIDFVLLIPLFCIYGLLFLGLWKNKSLLLRLLQYFAKGIEIIGLLCFGIVLLSYFFHLPFVSMNTLLDGLLLVFQITMIVAGSHVLCQLIFTLCQKATTELCKVLRYRNNDLNWIVAFFRQFPLRSCHCIRR